jgi:hypothetical protein
VAGTQSAAGTVGQGDLAIGNLTTGAVELMAELPSGFEE